MEQTNRRSGRLKNKARKSYAEDFEVEEPFQTTAVVVPGAHESTHSSNVTPVPIEILHNDLNSAALLSSESLAGKRQSHSISSSSKKKTRRVSDDQTWQSCALVQPSTNTQKGRRVSDPIDYGSDDDTIPFAQAASDEDTIPSTQVVSNSIFGFDSNNTETDEGFLFKTLVQSCTTGKTKIKTVVMPKQGESKSRKDLPDLRRMTHQDVSASLCAKYEEKGLVSFSNSDTKRKMKFSPKIMLSEKETFEQFGNIFNSKLGISSKEVKEKHSTFPQVVPAYVMEVVHTHPRASTKVSQVTTSYEINVPLQHAAWIQVNTTQFRGLSRGVLWDDEYNVELFQEFMSIFSNPWHQCWKAFVWFVKTYNVFTFTPQQLHDRCMSMRYLGYLPKMDEECVSFLRSPRFGRVGGKEMRPEDALTLAKFFKNNIAYVHKKSDWKSHPANKNFEKEYGEKNARKYYKKKPKNADYILNALSSNRPHLRATLDPLKVELREMVISMNKPANKYTDEVAKRVLYGWEQHVNMKKIMAKVEREM